MHKYRRKLSAVIMVAFLVCMFAVPANASEIGTDNAINVLDYCTADNSGSNLISATGSTSTTVLYDLPHNPVIRYVDILFTMVSGFGAPTVVAGDSSRRSTLTVVALTDTLYRAYGSIPVTGNGVYLVFTNASGTTSKVHYEIFSFRAYGQTSYSFSDVGFLSVDYQGGSTGYVYMSDADTAAKASWYTSLGYGLEYNYSAYIYLQNFRKYDYADIFLQCSVSSVNSIVCRQDGSELPFEISYLDLSTLSWVPVDGSVMYNTQDWLYIMIRVDLSEIDRSLSYYPVIYVSGTHVDGVQSSITLMSYTGHVNAEGQSALMYWLQQIKSGLSNILTSIKNGFDSVISAIAGDSTKGEEFTDDIQPGLDDLDQSQEVLDSVTKPDLDAEFGDLTLPDGTDEGVDVIQNIFTIVLSDSYLGSVFMMAVMLALVSYLLYGRR